MQSQTFVDGNDENEKQIEFPRLDLDQELTSEIGAMTSRIEGAKERLATIEAARNYKEQARSLLPQLNIARQEIADLDYKLGEIAVEAQPLLANKIQIEAQIAELKGQRNISPFSGNGNVNDNGGGGSGNIIGLNSNPAGWLVPTSFIEAKPVINQAATNTNAATISGVNDLILPQIPVHDQFQIPPQINLTKQSSSSSSALPGAIFARLHFHLPPKQFSLLALVVLAVITIGVFLTFKMATGAALPTNPTVAIKAVTATSAPAPGSNLLTETPGMLDDAGIIEATPLVANDNLIDRYLPTVTPLSTTTLPNSSNNNPTTTKAAAVVVVVETNTVATSAVISSSLTASAPGIITTGATIAPITSTRPNIAKTYPVAVSLARLNITSKVQQDTIITNKDGSQQWGVPDAAAGHHTNSADCGEQGVTIVVGHNWWASQHGVFYALHLAQPGDTVSCTSSNGQQFNYKIINLSVHGPDDVSWYYAPTEDKSQEGVAGHYLILYTCTSDFKNRIVVVAKQL